VSKVITYNINEDIIEGLADYIDENYLKKGKDLTRLAFVFEGRRPTWFLNKLLAKKMKRGFFPPRFFSVEEFVEYTLSKNIEFRKITSMESCYMIYTLAKDIAPDIIRGREKFSQFLPWAREIAKFVDSLDMEGIPPDALKEVQASAAIGYEIPENINVLLKHINAVRLAYHKLLSENNLFSKGYMYLTAVEAARETNFDEFDEIFFCGFFYMQKTEKEIVKRLYDAGKAGFFFHGDEDKWPVLKSMTHVLGSSIKPARKEGDKYSLNLYSAFDKHSQVCTVREILKKIRKLDSTVVVLPDSGSMIPLVSEIGTSFGDFNVSLGYPIDRSSLYSLFVDFIFQAQKTRKDKEYYAKDYIDTLKQPIVKNLEIRSDARTTRVLIHKIEEAISGIEDTPLSGSLFIKLEDIENEPLLFELASRTLRRMDVEVHPRDLQKMVKELNHLLFAQWEDVSNFHGFAESLGKLLGALVKKSYIRNYGLNLKIADKMYSLKDELLNAPFSREEFAKEDIFKIFQNMLENDIVRFRGSPLSGLQILGGFEIRSLNFENVIIMDANESVLPRLRMSEPLIPRDVSLNLGLKIIENEEEIQRYQFRRIISAAREVHIIYEDNPKKERSRFVEELIWQNQKEEKAFDILPITHVGFSVNVLPAKTEIKKNEEIIEALKALKYSATSIDTYVQCPLRFYFKSVLRLKEQKKFPEDPEGKDIGSFIHELLKGTLGKFVDKAPKINKKFREDFFKRYNKQFEKSFGKSMRSDSFLLKEIMRFRLEKFLDSEESRYVNKILYVERQFDEDLKLSGDTFKFTYIVDRVDRLADDSVLILDYKTGADTIKPQKTESLEKMELKRESIRDRIKSFQLPLYYYFEKKKYKDQNLNAALYNLRNLKLTYLEDERTNLDRTMELCLKGLDFILHEILDLEKPFIADCRNEKNCSYCPFFYLCR
jgi:RecB family exonuclease